MRSTTGLFFVVALSAVFSCSGKHRSRFTKAAEAIFFNVDLSGSYADGWNHLKTIRGLEQQPLAGWAVYPPLSALAQESWDSSRISFDVTNRAVYGGKGKLRLQALGNTGAFTIQLICSYHDSSDAKKQMKVLQEKLEHAGGVTDAQYASDRSVQISEGPNSIRIVELRLITRDAAHYDLEIKTNNLWGQKDN